MMQISKEPFDELFVKGNQLTMQSVHDFATKLATMMSV